MSNSPAAIPTVAVALGNSDWESPLFSRISQICEKEFNLKRSVELVDLISLVASGQVQGVILDSEFPGLNASTVDRLTSLASVVGVCEDLDGEDKLSQWTLADPVLVNRPELEQSAHVIVKAISQLIDNQLAAQRDGKTSSNTSGLVSGNDGGETSDFDLGALESNRNLKPAGSVVALWSAVPRAGVTTIAIGVAEVLSAQDSQVMIIDSDLHAPGVVDALGFTEQGSGLLVGTRLAEQGNLKPTSLEQQARSMTPSLRVLSGIPAPHRRGEIRPTAFARVIDAARSLDRHVVVDLGSPWAHCSVNPLSEQAVLDLEEQSPVPTSLLAKLSESDASIMVMPGDPRSVARSIPALRLHRELNDDAPLWVVVNQVRPSMTGGGGIEGFRELLADLVPPHRVLGVRSDQATADEAILAGRTLAEVSSQSVAARDIRHTAMSVSGGSF